MRLAGHRSPGGAPRGRRQRHPRPARSPSTVHASSHLDTADAYGPHTVEETHRPRPCGPTPSTADRTRSGMFAPAAERVKPLGRPEYLRAAAEMSLRRLGVERLELCYLHRIDPAVPLEDQIGELRDLQSEGKIGHIGLSKVTVAQIRAASTVARIAAVQNCLNLAEPDDPALVYCAMQGIPLRALPAAGRRSPGHHRFSRQGLGGCCASATPPRPIPGTSFSPAPYARGSRRPCTVRVRLWPAPNRRRGGPQEVKFA
ncbi:aldo/keto reductase [Streptomyces sp. HK10]|uniref:aldo/keto reductase n=1 Tax=Streptomyces sp. HK10 TaxID=3373255 RepID=UPI003748A04A